MVAWDVRKTDMTDEGEHMSKEMRIIKRDGREERFDIEKVRRAIQGANQDLNAKGLHKETLRDEGVEYVVAVIESWAEDLGHTPHVEEVQNEVHNLLAEVGRYELARQYEAYRTEHAIERDTAVLFARAEAIVDCVSEEARQENSNKNVDVVSVQRDYIAGEVSRAYTEQKLLPDDILTAHREGVIHFHDTDYFMTREHNCFVGSTAFVTSKGLKTFDELGPDRQVKVLDLKGQWRDALTDYYGYQETQDVTLTSGDTTKTIRCTQDHAWILENGTRTETLKVGDVLMPLDESGCQELGIERETWIVTAIEPTGKKENVWCVKEPVTHTFTLADGIVTGNCGVYNLEDMLQNGTVISGTMIEKPHSFSTACNIATQVIAQIASTSYGGQTFTLAHLAPFVDVSRKKFAKRLADQLYEANDTLDQDTFDSIVESQVRDEVKKGIQTIQYQLITLMTTNGQAPFVSVFMWLDEVPEGQVREDLAMMIEETIRQRYEGVKDKTGNWITPAFPKLLYVLDEDNAYEGSRYFYLTKLAAQCTARRLVPDYVSAKKMRELKLSKGETAGHGDIYGPMGCRSFLTPDRSGNGFDNVARAKNWQPGKPKYYGRFNQGVVTINLPDVALSSGGDMDKFWEIFEERLELCHRALRLRHERLKGTLSDAAPILWQHGALARLDPGEKIDPLLYGGYSTISLGYAGLYECVKYMTGVSHTDHENGGHDFAIAVMQKMNDKCAEWKAAEDIDYSIYGTPIESTTYKFAKSLQRRFGIIPDVTDHGYITNSYHVNVREDIDAFTKLTFESEFQHLSPGGAISYVEVPDMQDNIDAVIAIMQHIYENIIYAELNTKSDLCEECGYDGEIKVIEEGGKLVWECPNCGNRDQSKMHVARRTCGYVGSEFWNQGRTEEIRDRVLHA